MKVRLDEVCDIYKGKTTITKAVQGEYPLVVTAEERSSHNEYQFDCKAVCVPLVSATGHGHASIKRIHYQEGKFAIGTILAAVIPKDENVLDAKYLHIYLSYFKDTVIVPLMKGSANVSLTIKSLSSAEIEVPTIERQKEIVRLIDKIEKNKIKIDEKLEEQKKIVLLIRNEILSLAIKGKLVKQNENDEPASVLLERIKKEKDRLIKEKKIKNGQTLPEIYKDDIPYEIPKNWKWVRLNQIIDVRDGTHNTPKYIKEGIPLITSKNISSGKIEFSNAKHISYEDYIEISKRSKVDKGDILFAMIGSIGNPVLVEEDKEFAIKNVGLFKFYNSSFVINKYLYYYLILHQYYMKQKASGAVQSFVSLKFLREYKIALPPINEQKRIVEKLDYLMSYCDKLETHLEEQKKYAEMLGNVILKNNIKNFDM